MRIATYNFEKGELEKDSDGFCRKANKEEVGVLLTKLEESDLRAIASERVLRDVFEGGDAWYHTGSLLRVDKDGDFWFEERMSDLIQTARAQITSLPVEEVAYQLREVRLAAAYGLGKVGPQEIALALELDAGAKIDASDLDRVLGALEEFRRPNHVLILDEMPMTDGFRPMKALLRDRGVEGLGLVRRFRLEGKGKGKYVAA
jgi:acyl-CoA synthetase (AMP-forming)/AMP-acid ligase II